MFITPAYAQGAPGGGGDFFVTLLPFILIFAIMYFLIIRPQQKRLKDHREMVTNVRRGDMVVTSGGLIGRVLKVEEQELQIEVADGIKVRVLRGMLSEVRSKGEPVAAGGGRRTRSQSKSQAKSQPQSPAEKA